MEEGRTSDPVVFWPIGIIRTPFETLENMPIQPTGAAGVEGEVRVFPEFAEGLADLDGFSHVILIYQFHKAGPVKLRVTPFLDNTERGLFATRAPSRPNPVGLSVVRLTGVEGRTLFVRDVDVLDKTPLLDVKPYVPRFDSPGFDTPENVRCGWLEKSADKADKARSDGRFTGGEGPEK